MKYINVYKYAKENNVIKASAIPSLKTSEKFFRSLKIKVAVEIGTFWGITAAHIAQFANKVHTFDIIDHPEKYKVWNDLKVKDKISFHLVKSRDMVGNTFKDFEEIHKLTGKEVDIKTIIDTLEFDFAFIDGDHNYRNVKADFELVKKCGRVLFHDIIPEFEGVNKFVHEIGIKQIFHNIGYWESEKC